ncbi:MAG: PGPGW domain-containing protein [Pirellulales bacterium]
MDWIESHQAWCWWLFAASLAMLVVSPLLVGWLIVRLPTEYFSARRRKTLGSLEQHQVLRPVIAIVKNVVGMILVAAGVLMLFVPGQGVLTIAAGILLLDFPGKYGLERWLVTRPRVWRSINWLRTRAGRQPFESPEAAA